MPNFWLGMYKNLDGDWLWLDNSAVDYVNWKESSGQDSSRQKVFIRLSQECISLNAENGEWVKSHCSNYYYYVCKKRKVLDPTTKPPASEAKKVEEAPAPSHGTAGIVVAVVLLIMAGTFLAVYFFYKRKSKHLTDNNFDNTMYFDGDAGPSTSDTKDLVNNIEQNEHAII